MKVENVFRWMEKMLRCNLGLQRREVCLIHRMDKGAEPGRNGLLVGQSNFCWPVRFPTVESRNGPSGTRSLLPCALSGLELCHTLLTGWWPLSVSPTNQKFYWFVIFWDIGRISFFPYTSCVKFRSYTKNPRQCDGINIYCCWHQRARNRLVTDRGQAGWEDNELLFSYYFHTLFSLHFLFSLFF